MTAPPNDPTPLSLADFTNLVNQYAMAIERYEHSDDDSDGVTVAYENVLAAHSALLARVETVEREMAAGAEADLATIRKHMETIASLEAQLASRQPSADSAEFSWPHTALAIETAQQFAEEWIAENGDAIEEEAVRDFAADFDLYLSGTAARHREGT